MLVPSLCRPFAAFCRPSFCLPFGSISIKKLPRVQSIPSFDFWLSKSRNKILRLPLSLLGTLSVVLLFVFQSIHYVLKSFHELRADPASTFGEPSRGKKYCRCLCRPCAVLVPPLCRPSFRLPIEDRNSVE